MWQCGGNLGDAALLYQLLRSEQILAPIGQLNQGTNWQRYRNPKFDELTNGWPFMYHCHNLMHEDNMMMLQFIVEENPSTAIAEPPTMGEVSVFPSPTASAISFSDTPRSLRNWRMRSPKGVMVCAASGAA